MVYNCRVRNSAVQHFREFAKRSFLFQYRWSHQWNFIDYQNRLKLTKFAVKKETCDVDQSTQRDPFLLKYGFVYDNKYDYPEHINRLVSLVRKVGHLDQSECFKSQPAVFAVVSFFDSDTVVVSATRNSEAPVVSFQNLCVKAKAKRYFEPYRTLYKAGLPNLTLIFLEGVRACDILQRIKLWSSFISSSLPDRTIHI